MTNTESQDNRRKVNGTIMPVLGEDRREHERVDAVGGWQCCMHPAPDLCYEGVINISEGGASFFVPTLKGKTPTVNDIVIMDFILLGVEFSLKSLVVRLSYKTENGVSYTRAHLKFIDVNEEIKLIIKSMIVKVQVLNEMELTVTGALLSKKRKHNFFKIVSKKILLQG